MMHDVYDGGHPWLGVPTRSSYSSVAILNYYIGVVIDKRIHLHRSWSDPGCFSGACAVGECFPTDSVGHGESKLNARLACDHAGQ